MLSTPKPNVRKPKYARKRCQAKLENGERCSREATFQLDLKTSRKVFNINLPTADCCYFCTQHSKMIGTNLLAYGILQMTPILAKGQMTEEQKYLYTQMQNLETI